MSRLAVAGIAALTLAGLLFTLSRIDDVAVEQQAPDDRLPRYTLTSAQLTRYDTQGQPALTATAATLEYFDDESAQATTLVIDVISGTTRPWHLEAPTGTLKAGSREMQLQGDVVANGNWPDNGEPVILKTPTLWVDPDSHTLRTDAVVQATSRSRNGTATGMNANWMQHDLHLLNNVKMRYEATR